LASTRWTRTPYSKSTATPARTAASMAVSSAPAGSTPVSTASVPMLPRSTCHAAGLRGSYVSTVRSNACMTTVRGPVSLTASTAKASVSGRPMSCSQPPGNRSAWLM
jgi:hypothetical protein